MFKGLLLGSCVSEFVSRFLEKCGGKRPVSVDSGMSTLTLFRKLVQGHAHCLDRSLTQARAPVQDHAHPLDYARGLDRGPDAR